MKKLVSAALAAAVLATALAGCGGNSNAGNNGGESIELIYSSTRNEKADIAHIEWMEDITEATGGKVQFETYFSNSLISNTRDIPDALVSGIADVAMLNVYNYPSLFPLNTNIVSIPFTGITDDCRLDIMDYMYDKYPELEQEFTDQGLKLLGWSMTNANNLGIDLGKEYTGLSDIKNMDISGSNDTEMNIINAVGAVPVSVAFPEMYQSLEKNVISGLVNHSAAVYAMSFYEHLDNWVVFGEGSGICSNLIAVCMSLEKWESLPDDVKAAFEDAEDTRNQKETETQMQFDAELKKAFEEEGKHYVVLDDEQIAEWKSYAQPIIDQILADMEAEHPGFGAMYEDLCQYVENYGK